MKQEKIPAKRIRVLVAILAFWGLGITLGVFFLSVYLAIAVPWLRYLGV